ncbi:MAG: hypothetical protein JW827_07300 [Spirochaetes bacterium]|nr:hypothetical protein [Spirochaetota bacterium]
MNWAIKIFFFLVLWGTLSTGQLISRSADNKSSQITIDGISSDFDIESDQILLSPDLTGIFHESENDSRWGTGNDISRIKLTWDRQYLYVSLDGSCADNSMILYFDTGQTNGINTVSSLNAWRRIISFENISPDFFLASWDGNDTPQFWKILSEENAAEKTWDIQSKATFQGSFDGAMEAKIPWNVLYSRGDFNIITNAVLKIVGAVVAGDDRSGPDGAPDPSDTLPADSIIPIILDNFLIITLDNDTNGLPDIGVGIRDNTTVAINVTALKFQPLEIRNVQVDHKSFSPNDDGVNDSVAIRYLLSKDARVTARIYHIEGKLISTLQDNASLTGGYQSLEWLGTDDRGVKQHSGLYLIHIKAKSMGISIVKKIPVFLIE